MIKTLNLNKKAQDILSNSVSASRVTDWENLIKRPNFEQLLDEEIAKFQQTQAGKTSATVATDEIQNMRAPDTAVDYGLLYGAGVPQVNGGRVVVSDINQLVADKQNTGTQSAPVLSNNALSPEEILLGTGRAGRTFADNLTYGQAARYMGDANLFGGEKAATKAKETIAAKENYTGDWREAQENEMKALRDAIWAMDTDEQTPEQQAIIARYQELIARRDPSSPFATTAFMPRDPLSQKWGNYLLDRGIGGLASSLEGVKNNVIDMAADQTRNGLLADYQAANAYGDIGASIDLIRGGSLSETEQLDTDALSQQLQGYRTTDWAEAAQEKEATYNVKDGTVLKTAGDVVSGAAGMAPSIVSNLVIPGSGMAVMFSSAAGNATTQALEAGADYDTAFTYGVVTGAVEIATEKITGGIPGLNAGWLDNIFDKTISKMTSNALGRYLIKMGANALGEGFEEWMSEAIGQYTVRIYDEAERGRDIGEVWREGRSDRLYAALVGALMSLVMQAPTSTKGKVSAYNTELNQLTVQNGMVDALASEGMTKAEAQQLAAQLIEQGVDPAAWMQPDTQNDQAAIDAGTAQAFQDAFVKQTQQGDQYQDLQVPVATEYTQDIGGAQNGREGQNVAELAGERSAQGEDLRGSAGSVLQVQGDRSGNSVSTDAGGGRATPAAMEGFSRAASEKGQRVIEYNGRNLAYKPYQGEIRAETSETTSILERRGHQPVLTAGDMSSFDLTTGRVVHGSDGLSLGDGTVLINANSKLNPKELAYHESFHAEWREGRHSSAILFNEFNVQCDTNSIEYENLLKAINNAQYQGKLDISNAEHRKSLLSETVAIYAGDMQGGGRFTSEYMPFLNQTPELAQAYEVFLADEGGNTDTTKKNPATSRPEITAQGGITGGLDSFRSEVNNLTSPLNSNLNQNMKGVDAGAVSANQATETTNDTASKAEQTADLRSLIAKMKDHLPEIVSMPPVASITGEEFSKSGRKLTETVGEFFRSIGNKVRRHGLGDIILDVRGIRSDIAHGFGRRKAAAFAAVPKVIENGIEIDYQTNWKDRGYDTYVFAAPIAVGNETNVVGVVVRKSNDNRLYLHEVIDGDGNLIYTKKEEPGAIKTGVTAQDGVTGWPNSSEVETVVSPLNSTINQNADVVNSSGEVTAQQAAVRAAIEDKPVNTSEKSPEQLEKVREMQAEIDKGDVGIIERETTVDDVGAAQALRNPTEGLRGYNKTLDRVLDVVAGKDTKTRQWLQEHIADPLYRAKAAYSAEVKTQLDTLKTNVADKLGIRKGSRESAAVMWLGEGRKIETYNKKSGEITYSSYSLEKLKADFPTSWQKIVAAEQYIRGVYDAYVGRINESLARIYPNVEQNAQAELDKLRLRAEQLRTDAHQMEEGVRRGEYAQSSLDSLVAEAQTVGARVAALQKKIDTGEIFKNKRLTPRNDYFHHFMEMEQGLGALKNLLRKSHDIDPALVGVSDFTKPKSKWQGFLQERSGGVYVEDAIGGLIKYIPQAEYSININPVVAEYRGVIKALATATKQTRNANGFIEWMTDYTNDLAGKTNPLDRAMQKLVSRKSLQALKWINGRVKSNAIMGNINSAVSQFFNIPNASLYVKNPAIWAKGFKDYARYLMSDADTRAALEQSGFMRERYLNNSVSQFDDKTVLNSPRRFAEWMLEFGDKEAARLIWFAAYEQGLARGDVDVIQYADDITRRSVAGRGIGEVPLAQKSELVKLIAPFQVEVSNAWYAFTERVKLGDMPAIASFLASSYLMNAISRALTGRTVSMDLIQTIIDIMQEAGAGDDDEEKTAGQIAALAATRLGGEMLGNMPFGTQIGSIITGGDDTKAQRLFGETDPTRFGTGNIGLEALLNPVIDSASNLAEGKPADFDAMSYITNFALPFGGKQMDRSLKMAQALGWVPKDGILGTPIGGEKQDMAASYSDSGRLRFPIDDSDPMNVLAGLLFGEWATKEGKGYLDGGTNTYSDKKTAQVEQAAAMGIEPNVFIDYLDSADADGNGSISRAESRNYLQEEVDAFTRAQQAFIWSTAGSGISETQQAEIDKAERVGISETDYLLMLMLANEDGEGKLRQDEAQAYIDEYLRGLTTAQKRFLWQSTTGTTSTKNNPY